MPATMGHLLYVRKAVGGRIVNGIIEGAMERIVLQRATVDEGTPVWQHHHAIAEHVPCHRLSCNSSCLWVPQTCLIISVAGDVARSRYDQHLSIVQKRHVNRINGHGVRQRGPITGHVGLGPSRHSSDAKDPNGQGKASKS